MAADAVAHQESNRKRAWHGMPAKPVPVAWYWLHGADESGHLIGR